MGPETSLTVNSTNVHKSSMWVQRKRLSKKCLSLQDAQVCLFGISTLCKVTSRRRFPPNVNRCRNLIRANSAHMELINHYCVHYGCTIVPNTLDRYHQMWNAFKSCTHRWMGAWEGTIFHSISRFPNQFQSVLASESWLYIVGLHCCHWQSITISAHLGMNIWSLFNPSSTSTSPQQWQAFQGHS